MNKIERHNFNCPALGGIADVRIEKSFLTVDELPQPIPMGMNFRDCADNSDAVLLDKSRLALEHLIGIFVPANVSLIKPQSHKHQLALCI